MDVTLINVPDRWQMYIDQVLELYETIDDVEGIIDSEYVKNAMGRQLSKAAYKMMLKELEQILKEIIRSKEPLIWQLAYSCLSLIRQLPAKKQYQNLKPLDQAGALIGTGLILDYCRDMNQPLNKRALALAYLTDKLDEGDMAIAIDIMAMKKDSEEKGDE